MWNLDTSSEGDHVGDDADSGGSRPPAASKEVKSDPLMVVARNVSAMATYQESSERWTFVEIGSLRPLSGMAAAADWPSYKLLRPYQRLLRPAGGGGDWRVTVQNVNLWLSSNLTFALRAKCVSEPQCPAFHDSSPITDAQPCGGVERGTCRVHDERCSPSSSPAESQGCALCECQPGWGDVSCNARLAALDNGEELEAAVVLEPGAWHYYEVQVDKGGGELLVELRRQSGDPVLFVKPASRGFQPGSLPTVLDYDQWADGVRFSERVNDHWLHLANVSAGRHYVGVYNYESYIQEGARYELKARWTGVDGAKDKDVAKGNLLCPKDCSGHGQCHGDGRCECDGGWRGAGCEFMSVQVQQYGLPHSGQLQPGEWVFFEIDLKDTQADRVFWADGLVLQFRAVGGHPVLLAAHGRTPSLASNDILFSWRKLWTGEQRFYVKGADLQPGKWVLGVFDMAYYLKDPFEYTVVVDSASFAGGVLSPYWSIGLGVSASLFLCALFSIFRRILWERHLARVGAEGGGPGQGGRGRRGVPQEVLDTFPTRRYKPPGEEEGATQACGGHAAETASDAEDSCTVCLCEYEDGEMVRELPCGHAFHQKCIDMWMTAHTTCPICRYAAVPDPAPGFEEAAAARGEEGASGGTTEARRGGQTAIELLEVGVARQHSTNASTGTMGLGTTTTTLSTGLGGRRGSSVAGDVGTPALPPPPPQQQQSNAGDGGSSSADPSSPVQRLLWRGFGVRRGFGLPRGEGGGSAAVPLNAGGQDSAGNGGMAVVSDPSSPEADMRVARRPSVVDHFTNLFGRRGGLAARVAALRGGPAPGAQQLPHGSV